MIHSASAHVPRLHVRKSRGFVAVRMALCPPNVHPLGPCPDPLDTLIPRGVLFTSVPARSVSMRAFRFIPAFVLAALSASASAQTAFTYQGELHNGAAPAAGSYDFRFILYDLSAGGSQQGNIVCANDVQVADGRFTAVIDPGTLTPALERWLEIAVRDGAAGDCSNPNGFTTLSPRQRITPAPSAFHSATADSATNSTTFNGQTAAFYRNASNLNAGQVPSTVLA